MALVGTISGSIGAGGALTSTTAISGTLVIADAIDRDFPLLSSDVKFFVSGSTTGAVSTSVFGGRVVVSGSTELKGNLTLSGTNVEIGGDVTFNNDLIYLDKANDRVGIGLSTPEATLSVRSQGTGNTRGFFGEHYDDTTAFSQFKFIGGRSRGSVGSPSAVQADDTLVSFNGRGRTDTGWSSTVGGMYVYAKENWTSTNTPTYITLRGVAAGAGTAVSEWAKIDSAGLTINGDLTGSSVLATGDITGSNLRITGDIAVIGGDITTTAATFNLLTGMGAGNTLNIGGSAATYNVGISTGTSLINIAAGTNTVAGATKTINIGTNTSTAGSVFVNIGSSAAREGNARITLNNEVHLTSGTLVGSPGGVNNALTLVSSGNIIAKLDTNNDAAGHKFMVHDYRGIEQFSVGENGNTEVSGTLLVSGSSIQTITTTTYNLLTTALTGTLNIGSLTNLVNVGGSLSTSSISGDLGVAGKTTLACVVERLVNSNGGTGTVSFDLTSQGIFYVNNPTGNITANFTNVPTTNNRVITPTVILSQSVGASRPIVSSVTIDGGTAQTINWANGVTPTGNSGKQDVFGFSLIRSGTAGSTTWKVLGQMSTYG